MTPPDLTGAPTSTPLPAGTSLSSGTAGAALIKAAQESVKADSAPAAKSPAGDTLTPSGAEDSTSAPDAQSHGPAPDALAAADSTAAASAADSGPIPREQHESAVKTARQEGIREGQRTYGWAKNLRQADVKEAMEIRHILNTDALGYHTQLTKMLTEQGILKPGGTSAAPPAAAATPFKLPRASHRSDDGEEFFSAKQMQEVVDGLLGEVDTRLKPINEERQAAQATAAETARIARVNQQGDDLIAELKQLPHYERFRKEMADMLGEMPDERRTFLGGTPGALMWAYNQLVNSKVLPSADSDAQKKVREDLAKKANASRGSVSPTNASPAPAAPVLKNARDLAKHMQNMENTITAG